jgi:hypothetical protein
MTLVPYSVSPLPLHLNPRSASPYKAFGADPALGVLSAEDLEALYAADAAIREATNGTRSLLQANTDQGKLVFDDTAVKVAKAILSVRTVACDRAQKVIKDGVGKLKKVRAPTSR